MNKFWNIFFLLLIVSTYNNQIASARSLRIKRQENYFSLNYLKKIVGLGTTTLEPCLEYAEDGTCLGETIELLDDTYEFKCMLTGAKLPCPNGSKLDRKKVCRKVLRR